MDNQFTSRQNITMTTTELNVPEGFARHFRQSPLTDPWEPLYSKRTDKNVLLGFRAAENHANSRGFVHGGLITSLADNAMGLSCGSQMRDQMNAEVRLVTISLSIDFMGIAKLGQWIEIDTSFVKTGRSVCFAQCFVTANGVPCAKASATFNVPQQKA